ncbi:nucleotidyltransferase AbiEii toxin of type IV toxin-antitoxin system [Enterobacter sp. BIGb0383]|nr:nucleotidyltransferase AbiEii toxin of type IV toxin-antitoxin system [Enterobacter sp. BIGb0383]ROS06242.1 nucleotidyltransferase AbiEii toxin of type IV toxin-antitoxin system [Enterobacter sp. BIGb0359]
MTKQEPQSAAEYEDRTTAAVKSVLIEIGQILGSYRGKFAVIGGAVPWLLLHSEDMPHVGTLDIDLGLDSEALGDGEYATLVDSLMTQGYEQRKDARFFQLIRTVKATDGGADIDIVIDFLRPENAAIEKNNPPLVKDFAVIPASGADLAIDFNELITLDGTMPGGGKNSVEITVCSVPALLAMKGYALNNRHKRKDAYDIYYCIRNYEGGPQALAEKCIPLLAHASAATGYGYINRKFDSFDGYGPTCVKEFVQETRLLNERTPEQWQQDAFGQVDFWLRAIKLRS